jgi:hypothetical protein
MAYIRDGKERVVSRAVATAALRAMLRGQGVVNVERYALHSGRIGAATKLAAEGHSDSAVMAAGRWKSTSFMAYIRPSTCESDRVSHTLFKEAAPIQP